MVTFSVTSCELGTMMSPLSRVQNARAYADAANHALKVADFNGVADMDRPLEQQDKTGDKLLTTLCSPKPMPTLKAPARKLTLEKSTPRNPVPRRIPGENNNSAARSGVGQAWGEIHSRINIFLQNEAKKK